MNIRLVVATLFFGSFVANMNGFALGPFLVPISEDIGSTVARVGQAATAALLIGAVVGLILGPLSDHFGLRRLVLVGTGLMALSGVGTALSFDYWSLVLTRIPAGIATGMVFGLGISLISTRLPEASRRDAIAWVAGSGAFAAIFGVPLMAVMGDYLGWRAGFWLVGALGIMLTIMYLRILSPDPAISRGRFELAGMFGIYRSVLSNRAITSLLVANAFWSIGWIGFVTYAGAFTMHTLNASLNGVGVVYTIGGVAFFVGNRSASRMVSVLEPRLLFLSASLSLATLLIVFFTMATTWATLLVIVAVAAFAGGLGLPTITMLIAEATSSAHGTVMMLRQFTWGVGAGLGAAAGGLAIGLGGYAVAGVVFATCALFAALALRSAFPAPASPIQVPVEQVGS